MILTKKILVLIILIFLILSCSEDDEFTGVWQSYDNPPYVAQYIFESSTYSWDLFLTNASGAHLQYGMSGNFRLEGANIFFTPIHDCIVSNSIKTNVSTTNVEINAPYSIVDNVMVLDLGNGYSNYNKFVR